MTKLLEPLKTESEVQEGAKAFDQTFRFEPLWPPLRLWFRQALASNVKVLFPQNYVLDDDSFTCLRNLVEDLYAESAYLIRLLEAPAGFPLYWPASWSQGQIWNAAELPLHENCMFSRHNGWGIYFSDSDFALLAGDRELLIRLESALPRSFEEQKQALIEDSFAVFGSHPPVFLLPLLSRLDGENNARLLLSEAGFRI